MQWIYGKTLLQHVHVCQKNEDLGHRKATRLPISSATSPRPRATPSAAQEALALGVARAKQEDWLGAAEATTEAIRLAPDLAHAYYVRALARQYLGDIAEIIVYVQSLKQ